MILTNNLKRSFELYQKEYEEKAVEILRSGWYVLGRELELFEKEWASYCKIRYCAGLGSGLDALCLAFRALGIGKGDEVIVPGNTYIASVMGVTINGAIPVFAEPDEYYSIDADRIQEKITARTKAVLAVHLYGIPGEMDKIADICKNNGLRLVEDCAQSHGAEFQGKKMGTFGDVGCFSFYPSKNLGAFGDAGAIVTNDTDIYNAICTYRNYGSQKRYYHKTVGVNSRLDEIQAGLLRVKLRHLEILTKEREQIAERYFKGIHNDAVMLPKPRIGKGNRNVWHQFVLRCKSRDRLIEHMEKMGIGTLIHYPVPPHLSEAYENLGHKRGFLPITEMYADEVCSIPIYNGMTESEQSEVIRAVNSYNGGADT